jgi:pSer/pThr/pTyr-binding forkhead associated (FHA) protein
MVHLLVPSANKCQFVIGRGHDSDMRVSDISVSRCHAVIKYEKGRFQLEDNLSKFGTLVLANDPFSLQLNHTTAIQIGRSVISFTLKPASTARFHLLQESPEKQKVDAIETIVKQKILATNQKLNQLIHMAQPPPRPQAPSEQDAPVRHEQYEDYQ